MLIFSCIFSVHEAHSEGFRDIHRNNGEISVPALHWIECATTERRQEQQVYVHGGNVTSSYKSHWRISG